MRNKLGDVYAKATRHLDPNGWEYIKSKTETYKESLDFLRRNGFIPMDIPNSKELASDIYDFASSRKLGRIGNESPPLIEGVDELPGVKK